MNNQYIISILLSTYPVNAIVQHVYLLARVRCRYWHYSVPIVRRCCAICCAGDAPPNAHRMHIWQKKSRCTSSVHLLSQFIMSVRFLQKIIVIQFSSWQSWLHAIRHHILRWSGCGWQHLPVPVRSCQRGCLCLRCSFCR